MIGLCVLLFAIQFPKTPLLKYVLIFLVIWSFIILCSKSDYILYIQSNSFSWPFISEK